MYRRRWLCTYSNARVLRPFTNRGFQSAGAIGFAGAPPRPASPPAPAPRPRPAPPAPRPAGSGSVVRSRPVSFAFCCT
ncbi:MAG: hypothetical protein A3H96_24180 [Acidobacteria bacterium RIFCSPLOWO2_02_FULL_67_36]|nr:MAG: hypothetical protein A3H96_24180 [Acidobacteria bacterium RIFCSPLOWO2_02_FULL_67_36]